MSRTGPVCETVSFHFPTGKLDTLFVFQQMVSSTFFLYSLRRKKIISFIAADSFSGSGSTSAFVPLKTLFHTLPLSIAYLMYMVTIFTEHFWLHFVVVLSPLNSS